MSYLKWNSQSNISLWQRSVFVDDLHDQINRMVVKARIELVSKKYAFIVPDVSMGAISISK
jgi:hypothetical protein